MRCLLWLKRDPMRIAIPLRDGVLSGHFGGSTFVALFNVDPATHTVIARQDLPAPPHKPGVLPVWIKAQGAELVITGGIGERALTILAHHHIGVVAGASPQPPEEAVVAWMKGELSANPQPCQHDHHDGCTDAHEHEHHH